MDVMKAKKVCKNQKIWRVNVKSNCCIKIDVDGDERAGVGSNGGG